MLWPRGILACVRVRLIAYLCTVRHGRGRWACWCWRVRVRGRRTSDVRRRILSALSALCLMPLPDGLLPGTGAHTYLSAERDVSHATPITPH